jgi:hypothetical protein
MTNRTERAKEVSVAVDCKMRVSAAINIHILRCRLLLKDVAVKIPGENAKKSTPRACLQRC